MLQNLSNLTWIVAALFTCTTFAAPKADYPKTSLGSQTSNSLLRENDALKVMSEASIAKPVESSRNIFGVGISQLSAERVVIFANEKAVRYNLSDARTAVGANFAYLPLRATSGLWGLASSIHYTYLEQRGTALTSLHWGVVDLGAMYRYEPTPETRFKPFAVVGAATNVFFQRGQSTYRTSEARSTGFATVGGALNLTRTLSLNSPLLWELTLRHKQVFGPSSERMDLSAGLWSLGMELAL